MTTLNLTAQSVTDLFASESLETACQALKDAGLNETARQGLALHWDILAHDGCGAAQMQNWIEDKIARNPDYLALDA